MRPKKQKGHIKREGKAWESDSERKLDPGDQTVIDVLRPQGSRCTFGCGTGPAMIPRAWRAGQAISQACKGF
jgi:hypothetical protein